MSIKRGYSRDFTPRTETYGRYLLDKIPATLWRDVRAKAKREGTSIRALVLQLLTVWVREPTGSLPDAGRSSHAQRSDDESGQG